MALDLELMPGAPARRKKKENEEDNTGLVEPGNINLTTRPKVKNADGPDGSSALDLSLMPGAPAGRQPKDEPKTEPLNVRRSVQPIIDAVRKAAPAAAEAVDQVPGSEAFKHLQDLYGPGAPPIKPVKDVMQAGKDFSVKAGGVFKIRPAFINQENLVAQGKEPQIKTPEQAAWEKDVNALVESEGLDLAKKLAAKRNPDLAAAQRGQKQLQVLSDLGLIAASAGATGAITGPIAALPKIAKLITEYPVLARMVEAGAVGVPFATLKDIPKADQSWAESFAHYPSDVAQTVVGFMAFSTGAQLAGAALDKALFQKTVDKLPARSLLLTKDFVRDFYALSGSTPETREFSTLVPGFKELAAKTFKTGEETMVVIPESTITKISARPWYQELRKIMVKDITPIKERTLFSGGGEPYTTNPPAKALPGPGERPTPGAATAGTLETPLTPPKSKLDLSQMPDKPAGRPLAGGRIDSGEPVSLGSSLGPLGLKYPENAYHIKAARKKGLDDEGIINLRYTDERSGLLNQNFMEEVRTPEGKKMSEIPAVMADLDNFGAINKKYGHHFGNAVIRDIGRLFREFADQEGLVPVRDGGEEIKLLMMKGQHPVDVMKKLEAVREKLGQIVYTDDVTGEVLFTGVNFSAGFGTNSERADKRLYEAKKAGKGRSWPIDKAELEMYNKIGGTNHELEGTKTADNERPGTPKAVPQDVPPPGDGDAGRKSTREIRASRQSQEVTPPATDPTATYTDLLEQIVPQEKKAAGEEDIIQFIRRRGNIKSSPDTAGEVRRLRGMRVTNEKSGKLLDNHLEAAIEDGFLPEGSSESDLTDLIETQNRTGKKIYPTLGGSDILPPRPVSHLSAAELDQAVKDFEDLSAKRPLTDNEDGIFTEVKERRANKTESSLDLSRMPGAPAGRGDGESDIPDETLFRIMRMSEVAAKNNGEDYEDVVNKAMDVFREIVEKDGLEEAKKVVIASEKSLGLEPPTAKEIEEINIQPKREKKKPASSGGGGSAAMRPPDKDFKGVIRKAGGEFKGIMGKGKDELVLFNDPETGSTLALPPAEVTPEVVARKIESSRADFERKRSSGGGGSGAAARAPSTKPRQGETGIESEEAAPPDNPVWPGAPHNFVPHHEMPEGVRLWRMMMGDFPALRRLRRNLAYFSGARGQKLAKLTLDLGIFKDPVEATKLFFHEIGHWLDWLPDYILARGNILGRLKSLHGYRKTLIDPLPTANDALDPVDRKKLQNKAIKEALSHTDYRLGDYIKNAQIRQAMKVMIKETYDDLLAKEIKAKGLVTNEQVMAELKAVTGYWHPFDPGKDAKYTAYRYSAKELYAEALSMLFNEPVRLQEMAPVFWKTFWANLEKKPDVKQALLTMDEMLASESPKIQEQRAGDVRAMFEKGEKLWYQKRKERFTMSKRVWLRLKTSYFDINSKTIEDVEKFKKTKKLNPEDDPTFYLEEKNYLGGKLQNLIEDIERNVSDPVRKYGITEYHIGTYGLLRRIIEERKEIANTLGFNVMTAPKDLAFLRSQFTGEALQALDAALEAQTQMTHKIEKEAFAVGLRTPEIAELIAKNDAYMPNMVLDHLNDYASAHIINQVGSLKEIANPFTAWVMKMIAVKRAIVRELTRKKVVEFYSKEAQGGIQDAEYRVLGMRGDVPIREVKKKEGFGIIETHTAGKRNAFYVDPYVADSVNFSPAAQIDVVLEIIRWSNRTWFRPIQTSLNLAYQSYNLFFRDFPRAWKLNPDASFLGMLTEYFKSTPDAASRVWAQKANPIIHEMREKGMLGMTYNDLIKGMPEDETQLEYITRRYGVGRQDKRYKIGNPFSAALSLIGSLADFGETLPKVVGYKTRMTSIGFLKRIVGPDADPNKTYYISPSQIQNSTMEIAREVRLYAGSPDFWRRGSGFTWFNEVFPYSNAQKEGIRADLAGSFADPRTRGGYWWKTATINLLPTLIKFLAAAGFFGYATKKIMDRQTEYTKTNYNMIPLGMTDNDQSVVLTIPSDDMGRIWSGLFWKVLNADGDFLNAAKQIAGFTIAQTPGQASLLAMMTATMQYVTGQNPYDYYRGRNILSRDEQLVGGMAAAKQMGRWYLDKLGLSIKWGYRNKPGDPTIVKVIKYAPILNRYIRITDYGLTEQKRAGKAPQLERRAARRIDRREKVREARKKMKVLSVR